MIPKLRRKFISITACTLFAVLVLVVGSINGIFFFQNTRLLSSHLDGLLAEYGSAPKPPAGLPGEKPGPAAPKEPGQAPEDFHLLPRFEDRLKVRPDGCVLLMASDGSIADIRQDNAGRYSREELEAVADAVLSKGRSEGWQKYYKFRVVTVQTPEGESQTLIGLVNGSSALYAVFNALTVSALIGALCFLLILSVLIVASGRAVRPIAESYAKQKQFVTDAGHELKTPLTVLSADNELARMTFGDSEWFDNIDKQVARMDGLVRSLITLAKMDEGQKPVFTRFSLSDAAFDTARSFEHLSRAKGRELALDISDGIFCLGDESRIRQMISILMDNAVKYCDAEGKISVSLHAGRGIRLQITNDYAKASEFEPEKVFERFYRADKARTEPGSYGLGLSIARSIARQHRGEIRAKALDGCRVRFEVTLPLTRPGDAVSDRR